MSIPFVRRSKASPLDGTVKYYPQIGKIKSVGIEQISQEISEKCTVTRADIAAVLSSLEDFISESIQQHKTVRLGTLGSFRLGLSSYPSENEQIPPRVKRWHVRFSSSGWLRRRMKPENLSFTDTTKDFDKRNKNK